MDSPRTRWARCLPGEGKGPVCGGHDPPGSSSLISPGGRGCEGEDQRGRSNGVGDAPSTPEDEQDLSRAQTTTGLLGLGPPIPSPRDTASLRVRLKPTRSPGACHTPLVGRGTVPPPGKHLAFSFQMIAPPRIYLSEIKNPMLIPKPMRPKPLATQISFNWDVDEGTGVGTFIKQNSAQQEKGDHD